MNDPDRRREAELARPLGDGQRVIRIADAAADHRVDRDVELGGLAPATSFWSSTFRLFFDTSSGITLSMLICR